MTLPTQVTEPDVDDINSTDFSIDDLYARFIGPIEAKRSMSAPNSLATSNTKKTTDSVSKTAQTNLDNVFIDNTTAQESRAHAFYRMIGLPVVNPGGFYNPGYDPNRGESASTKNSNIANAPDPDILSMQISRESEARKRINLFKNSLTDASVFALGQQYIGPFKTITKPNFSDLDPQRFTIKDRKDFISQNYQISSGNPIINFFDTGTHILRPFCVNSVIDSTVMPANRQVCVPFLKDKDSTRLEQNVFLDRPGIEFILRLRLSEISKTNLLAEIVSILKPTQITEGITDADLLRIGAALSGKQNIDISSSLNLALLNLGSVDLSTLNDLVKIIKSVIKNLADAVNNIGDVIKNINWTPLPSELGPEDSKGMQIAGFVQLINSTSVLEQQITQLNIKSLISKSDSITPDSTLGNFALSYFKQTQKLYDDELNTANEQKNNYIQKGAQALRIIEIITGEVSGLGLIDILAIYTALWAIDLDVLVSLLDSGSFQRLVTNNVNLINPNVKKRMQNPGLAPIIGIDDAMQQLEDLIFNILSFADKLYKQQIGQPEIVDGGSSIQGN